MTNALEDDVPEVAGLVAARRIATGIVVDVIEVGAGAGAGAGLGHRSASGRSGRKTLTMTLLYKFSYKKASKSKRPARDRYWSGQSRWNHPCGKRNPLNHWFHAIPPLPDVQSVEANLHRQPSYLLVRGPHLLLPLLSKMRIPSC